MRHILKLALLAGLIALPIVGCGGSQTPTEVTPGDLGKTAQLWNELTPALKRELIDFGKRKLGTQRPEGTEYIAAQPSSSILLEMDRRFSEAANDETTIYAVYVEANDEVAREKFKELAPYLGSGP